jgi:biopolymer transport protein TolQ
MCPIWQHSLALSQGSIYRLIVDASPFAKVILIVLLGFSVISWAVIIEKIRFFRAADRYSDLLLRRFREGARLEELAAISKQTPSSPYSSLLNGAESEIRLQKGGNLVASKGSAFSATEDVVRVRSALNRTASTEVSKMESYLTFLATTGSVTPFVGLLGTVWGVMSAFLSMGLRGSATLAVVAPGIAEALIATVAGLAAAIPAVVAYNYFLGKVRGAENDLTKFISEFCDRLSGGLL